MSVTNGTSVRWGLLGAILVGTPLLAYYEGLIGFVQLIGGGVESALGGVEWFLSSFIGGFFGGFARALGSSWSGFLRDVELFGPGAFIAAAVATATTGYLVVWGVSRAR
ncbi:hypothetical protein [Halolamina sp.]|uniref:hypothetical protein n=1 Tax=Halolamina sp. TaxID=1940283 RepID=UPI003564E449